MVLLNARWILHFKSDLIKSASLFISNIFLLALYSGVSLRAFSLALMSSLFLYAFFFAWYSGVA